MAKISEAQQYIINRMQEGCGLSSLYTHDSRYREPHGFGVTLDDSYRKIPITTITAMLKRGLIVEKRRYKVTDDLEHIDYELNIIDAQDAIDLFPSPPDYPLDAGWLLP